MEQTLTAESSAAVTPVGRFVSLRALASVLFTRFGVVFVWLAMSIGYAIAVPDTFLTFGTFQTIFGSQSTLVFLCMAAVCTFVVGEFDLSIASIMGLSATVLPVLAVQHGLPEGVALLVALAVGALCGAVNGLVVVVLGVDPIVTTLGMSVLLLGVAQWISNLVAVTGLSSQLADLAVHPVGGLPISFYYGLALVLVFALVLGFTPLGRHMTFVGANKDVARLSGVRVDRIRFGAYMFSGLSSAFGGVILAASVGGFDSNTSGTYLLPALAATFLGTAVVQPGRFNPIGTAITIYFLVTGIVGLQLLGYASWVSNVFYGFALVVAVTLSTVARSRLVRR
jgi:ribose transport system permease protein